MPAARNYSGTPREAHDEFRRQPPHLLQQVRHLLRPRRPSEFWFFNLFLVLLYIVLAIIDGITKSPVPRVIFLAVVVPSLAVTWRRLHDTGRSGAGFSSQALLVRAMRPGDPAGVLRGELHLRREDVHIDQAGAPVATLEELRQRLCVSTERAAALADEYG
jgi:Protein of unknown function (DUF805)